MFAIELRLAFVGSGPRLVLALERFQDPFTVLTDSRPIKR